MKTLFASALIALTFGTASFSHADDKTKTEKATKATFQAGVYASISSPKLNVNVNKVQSSKLVIRLMDRSGNTLLSQTVGKGQEAMRIRLDMAGLEDGVYRVEITDGASRQVNEVNLKTTVPAVESSRQISLN